MLPSSSPFFAAMEASQASHVNMEVAHVQSPPADLVVGHVAPAVAQGTNAHARKWRDNVVVQEAIRLAPSERHALRAPPLLRDLPGRRRRR
ncbi:hypothetical protein D1007_33445 [Hordeum vulgare]|nr:hypothetical protein D1007_33445 [Hordeum vulgare]